MLRGDVVTASPFLIQQPDEARELFVDVIAECCHAALAREASQRAAWGDATVGAYVLGKARIAAWWVMREGRVVAVELFKPWTRVPPVAPG